jgi:hypothetical protein
MAYFEEPVSANAPSQEAVEAGLANFKPRPSERFYRRMASAPWMAASLVTQRRVSMKQSSKFFKLAIPILVGLILAIGFAATPWGQAFATEVFKLFVHAESDTFSLSPEEINRRTNPLSETSVPLAYSALSISELETQLGFDIKEPTVLPDLFSFEGIHVSERSVDFVYQCSCGGRDLEIFQGPLADSNSVKVGVEATIEKIQVGEVNGEYVEGDFVIYPGTEAATWNPKAPVRRLRWVIDEMLFQITSAGGSEGHWGYVNKGEMIAIAEGLK